MVSKAQIKFVKSLQYKKYRKRNNLFVAEGPKVIDELLQSSLKIHSVYGISNALSTIYDNFPDCPVYEISRATLEKLSFLKTPNEMLALAEIPDPPPDRQIEEEQLLLALDGIQDPGNLGTIIRTADWFGIQNIICGESIADPYNPKVVQSAMGSLFRTGLKTGDLEAMLTQTGNTHRIYAATLDGQNLHQCKPAFPAVIVIGNESQGIQPSIVRQSHETLSIPKFGQAESLNASVSTAVFLNHFRQSRPY